MHSTNEIFSIIEDEMAEWNHCFILISNRDYGNFATP